MNRSDWENIFSNVNIATLNILMVSQKKETRDLSALFEDFWTSEHLLTYELATLKMKKVRFLSISDLEEISRGYDSNTTVNSKDNLVMLISDTLSNVRILNEDAAKVILFLLS